MKTFTTYAEKKAKQILNLLQGYTKGIRMTAILILLLMGVNNAWANKYWYAGGKNSWGNTTMTVSADNYYEYCDGTYNGVHQFKIKVSSNSWDNALDYNYTNWGFNYTNITNGNSSTNVWGENYDNTNICIYNGNNNTYYIIVYYPNTAINTTNKPIICASTTLPKSWTVVYNGNGNTGGSVPTDNTVYANNGSVTVKGNTGNLTKTGYTFSSWNTKADGSGTNRNANSTFNITAHTTLYAKWTANQYTITYKDQGGGAFSGTHASGYPTKHTYGTTTTLKTATKAGYTFDGWFTNSGCTGSAVSSLGATAYAANITLYAKWTAIAETKYDVTISANANGSVDPSGTQKVGASGINVTATADNGYKFKQWSYTAGAKANPLYTETTFVTATGNGTVTASFEEILYDITITSNNAAYGDVNPKSAEAGIATTVNIEATPVDGYEFVNWTAPSGITLANANSASTTITKATANGTVSATFQEKKYAITITSNYNNKGTVSPTSQNVGQHTPVQITATPKTGYRFVNWTAPAGILITNPNSPTTTITATQAGTVTANFEEKTANTVYLKPSDEWKNDNARFAVYYWKDSENGWVDMEDVGCTGEYYKADIPVKYTDIIFCRMNPNATEYRFEDGIVWNQSEDLKVPTDDKVLYSMTLTDNTYLYLKPNENWKIDGAKFEVYYNTSGDYIYMDDIGDGIYRCQKQSGKFTFRRKDPNNGYSEPWNVTNEMTVPTDGTNLYTIAEGAWSNGDGTWSTFSTGGGWTTYTEPNITIKLVKTTNGTITLGTTTSGNSDKTFNTSINSTYVLNIQPADGYVLASCRIQMGNNPEIEGVEGDTYTFCGDATITAEFAKPVDMTEQRVHGDELVNYGWVGGNGTKANPYTLYSDEAVRITVTALPTVSGKTAYYKFGLNEEQTENVFDWKDIDGSTATNLRVTAYYKDANGNISDEHLGVTAYYKFIPLPFYLMTDPNKEINIENIVAGENILVQFRSETPASVSLYVKKDNEAETSLINISNKDAHDYTYDVPNNIGLCVLNFIARASTPVHGRTFEAKADVAIYKNIIIKVNDTEGWVKDVYLWRDGSGDVLTSWPGNPVLQNFGTWRVFSVKYPYYDRFIVNNGQTDGVVQTIGWVVPEDDRCYELVAPEDYDHAPGEDEWKYGLKEADCPADLIVSDIENVTISVGEEQVIMPEIFVGLGHQLSDVTMDIKTTDSESKYVRLLASGTNIILIGKAVGTLDVTVTYTLGGLTVEKTFKVTITTSNTLTITVKVPRQNGDGSFQIGWENTEDIKIYYEAYGLSTASIPMNYLGTFNDYYYMQAQVPFGNGPDIDFVVYWQDRNEWWKKSKTVENVKTDGCYVISQGSQSEGARPITLEANGCKFYQVKVRMQNGKTYQSNVGFAATDILSFFAPGVNEVGRNAGAVILYENNKAVKLIEPGKFETSDVYTASVNEDDYTLTNIAPYIGNFYIRTWGTDGDISNKGWNSVQDWTDGEKASRTFTKFVSREGEFYNHYWVQAMNSGGYVGKDVSACVANDYNDDLAGKLLQDKNTTETGDIKLGGTNKTINVRFGYDPRTNYFARAVLQGSEYESYLNMHCDNAYADKNCTKKLPYGNHTNNSNNRFRDISNWVYERDIYVNITNTTPSASVYVEGKSPHVGEDGNAVIYNHLLGYVTNEVTGEESETPIQKTVIGTGTNNGVYLVRVVYDFKTNRIITAWVPQGTIDVSTEKTINADVLFVRKENEDVPQINLSNQGKIKSLESMFFAMELHRGDTDAANRKVEQYWFTLPFDCKVGSISGVHGYLQIWGIQRYRGDLRAEKGWYAETPTFWEWMDIDDVMHAGEGYLLVFDKKNAPWNEIEVDKTDANGNIIEGQKEIISLMRLYFPSTTSGFDMQQQSAEQLTRTYENHTCTLKLHDRYLQDSNWKVIGTTSYNNAGITGYTVDTNPEYEEFDGNEAPNFRYSYNYNWEDDGKFTYEYTPEDGKTATYKSFYGYMVQFAGTISWQPIMSETVPEGIAARRYVPANERTSFTTRLEIANAEGEKQDQTFVALDEKATTTFDQNLDLNKVMNSHKANIYTLSEDIPFAGNTLPMEKATVPVGVRVATAGEYTFRMPDGTDGISVTLVDNVTGTHTDMLMDEYTITLDAGTIENRFYLVVDPDRAATSVENIGEDAKGEEAKDQIKKFLIDGQLFIRTADGIFDAKGQRL